VIENKFSPQLVLVTAVPPMQLFPALPNPLGWLFGQYSSGMNEKLIEFIQKKQNYQLIEFDLTYFKALNLEMAEDGFHPSKEIYQLWALAASSTHFKVISLPIRPAFAFAIEASREFGFLLSAIHVAFIVKRRAASHSASIR